MKSQSSPQWSYLKRIVITLFAPIFIQFNFILLRIFPLNRSPFGWDEIKLSTKCNVMAFYFHHSIHITNKVFVMGTFLLGKVLWYLRHIVNVQGQGVNYHDMPFFQSMNLMVYLWVQQRLIYKGCRILDTHCYFFFVLASYFCILWLAKHCQHQTSQFMSHDLIWVIVRITMVAAWGSLSINPSVSYQRQPMDAISEGQLGSIL